MAKPVSEIVLFFNRDATKITVPRLCFVKDLPSSPIFQDQIHYCTVVTVNMAKSPVNNNDEVYVKLTKIDEPYLFTHFDQRRFFLLIVIDLLKKPKDIAMYRVCRMAPIACN
jgi:hypothetical protein